MPPEDGLVDETSSKLADRASENDEPLNSAAKRLAQEARYALSFRTRGVTDITDVFQVASSQLEPGQLVKDEFFTLFEAVGALEIMDAKMDSGFVPPDDTFEPDFDVCRALDATEVLGVMDQLLCLEMVWHDGYPLSQTVFTSLHVDRLLHPENCAPYTFSYGADLGRDLSVEEQLVHVVLRAYCIGLIKCCQLVLHWIQSQNFYEEEDFVTYLFGRELLPQMESDEAAAVLINALSCVADLGLPPNISEALKDRLRFRKDLLLSLKQDTDRWSALIHQVEKMKQTHALAIALPEAFSDKVQRQLASSTPPRPMLQMPWDESCTKYIQMCTDLVEAERLTTSSTSQSPHGLQRATWAFADRLPPPNTFARSYLQDIICSDQPSERMSHFDLLLTDIRDIVLAGDPVVDLDSFQIEMPSDPRHICSRLIEGFMDAIFDEYLNIYRMVCQNRCRIRRTFTQSIRILDELEPEARRTDDELSKFSPLWTTLGEAGTTIGLDPLTSWIKYYKTQIMCWTIQLGFETDIYLPDELSSMYWLLSCVAHSRCSLLTHIEKFLVVRLRAATSHGETMRIDECRASQSWLRSQNILSNITRLLALALWRLTAILMTVRALAPPHRDYAPDPQLLYDARMKPFLALAHDPIPSLADFQRAQANVTSVPSSCAAVVQDVQKAKALLAEVKKTLPHAGKYVGTEEQWKAEMKKLETTCVAVAVQASQLARIWEQQGDGKSEESDLGRVVEVTVPEAAKRYHHWWVVPQIRQKQRPDGK